MHRAQKLRYDPELTRIQDDQVLNSFFRGLRRAPGAGEKLRAVHAPRAKGAAWHAVSIIGGAQACGDARQCGRRRFLSADAPRLPLPSCDGRACECRYRHHQDRRAMPRRQADRHQIGRRYAGTEQRVMARGRRASDA